MANFRAETQVIIDRELSMEANRHRLIEAAKGGVVDLVTSGRGSKVYQTVVDGRINGDIDAAQNQITFRFAFLADAAAYALSFLQHRVQQETGRTSKSFWVSVNGRYLPPGTFDPRSVPPDAEIVIGNLVPQWRRIDVNMNGNRVLKFRFPGDLMDCVRALNREFGKAVNVKRVYDYNFPQKYKAKQRGARYQSPALILTAIH